MVVLAAGLVGRLLAGPGPVVPRRLGSPRVAAITRAAGLALAAGLLASLVPAAVSRVRAEGHDLRLQRRRTEEIALLSGAVARLGGPRRLRSCGEPLTRLEYQTVLAWTLGRNVAAVGFKYAPAIRRDSPIVLYTPIPTGGWAITPLHQRAAACARLGPLLVR
jgi:hypothetical protein